MNGVRTHKFNFGSFGMHCGSLSIVEDCKAISVLNFELYFSAFVDRCLMDIYSTSQYSHLICINYIMLLYLVTGEFTYFIYRINLIKGQPPYDWEYDILTNSNKELICN